MNDSAARHSSRTVLVLAFLAVYIIWGSTYLAIRFAIETLPPLLTGGVRFLLAGSVLFAFARWRGAEMPTAAQWRRAFVAGTFLLVGGNGGVMWAEQRVPSALTALLIATVPLWMAVFEWARRESGRPSGRVTAGLAIGMCGVGLLVSARASDGGRAVDPVGAVVLVLGSASWAWGSLLARRGMPRSPFMATAMEMLAGGIGLSLAGALRGEVGGFDPAAVSLRSALAAGYLVVFGAIIAFTAYVYLLGATTPTRATTYAFVNPLVAVLLGWLLGGERLPPTGIAAAALIVIGVVLLVTGRTTRTIPREIPPGMPAPAAVESLHDGPRRDRTAANAPASAQPVD